MKILGLDPEVFSPAKGRLVLIHLVEQNALHCGVHQYRAKVSLYLQEAGCVGSIKDCEGWFNFSILLLFAFDDCEKFVVCATFVLTFVHTESKGGLLNGRSCERGFTTVDQ